MAEGGRRHTASERPAKWAEGLRRQQWPKADGCVGGSFREDRKEAPHISEDPTRPHCPGSSREGRTQTGSSRIPSPLQVPDRTAGTGGVRLLGRPAQRLGPTGQPRSQLRHPEYPREALLGGAAAARAHLRDQPGLGAQGRPGRQPSGQRCRGPRCWFPSSQTRSQSEPASWPLPPAALDLGGGKAAGHPTISAPLETVHPGKGPGPTRSSCWNVKPCTLGRGGGGWLRSNS